MIAVHPHIMIQTEDLCYGLWLLGLTGKVEFFGGPRPTEEKFLYGLVMLGL